MCVGYYMYCSWASYSFSCHHTYNLTVTKGQGIHRSGFWPYITDSVVYLHKGSMALEREISIPIMFQWSTCGDLLQQFIICGSLVMQSCQDSRTGSHGRQVGQLQISNISKNKKCTHLTNMYNISTPPNPSMDPNMMCQRTKNNDIQNNSCNS